MKNKLTETKFKSTPAGVRSIFASGLTYPGGLTFDSVGNLFVADNDAIYKFTPAGVRTTFAAGLGANGLAFDRAGNLFVAAGGEAFPFVGAKGAVDKFTATGVRTTFASGFSFPFAMAFV